MSRTTNKRRLLIRTILFGLISVCSYILLFANRDWIMNQFTLGGWNAIYPVGTAFFFSFIHATFAGNVLSLLGLEPKK